MLQPLPQALVAGQRCGVAVTMRNTGTTTWRPGGDRPHRLGAQSPQDNTDWGLARVDVPGEVPPGAEVTLTFAVVAPSTPGLYHFQWQMVQEFVEWFGDATPDIPVTVSVGNVAPREPTVCLDRDPTIAGLPGRQAEVPRPPHIASDGSVNHLGTSQQPLAAYTQLMWNTGQTVRVKMMGGTAFVRSKVRQFAEEWTKYANIRFEFVDPSQSAEIKIAFDKGGSWSMLGRDALGVPFDFATMNFGWFDDTTSDTEFSRVVLHEFGHALGLIHEHQSPTSGIQWDREKTYAHFKETADWDRGKVEDQVFRKYSVESTNYSTFDPYSIMAYWVPPELTLDGNGISGGTQLSATDKDYIGKWYPFPVTPTNADGLLRTGDDCDEIDFLVEYNAVGANEVEFHLAAASGIDWWKAIEVPIGGGDYRMLEIQDGSSKTEQIAHSDLDPSRPVRFWKAKTFGVHTRLGYTWDVISALPGGSRVGLTWKRDRC